MPLGTEGDEGKEKQTLCTNDLFMLKLHCSIELQRLLGFLRFIAHVSVYVCKLWSTCVRVVCASRGYVCVCGVCVSVCYKLANLVGL